MEYAYHVIFVIGTFTVLSVSLDLLVGHAGLLSISQAAFYGLGAYSAALLAVKLGVPFLVSLFAGMSVAAVLSLIVSLPSLRLHEDYLVMATFGFQMVMYNVFNNWMGLTNGPLGIADIPEPVIFGWRIESHVEFLILAVILAGTAYFVVWRITTSPFGRVLHAIREDEVFVLALGRNTLRFKVVTFALSAALAASAGSLYAHYITYIDPSSFTVMESILILSMVIIGGAGSPWGPLVGAVVLVTLPEVLRFVGLPSAVAANLRQIFYGTLLVILMMFRPRGLVGRYGFGR
jgi:branched-chain amino acid transport system permease protein